MMMLPPCLAVPPPTAAAVGEAAVEDEPDALGEAAVPPPLDEVEVVLVDEVELVPAGVLEPPQAARR